MSVAGSLELTGGGATARSGAITGGGATARSGAIARSGAGADDGWPLVIFGCVNCSMGPFLEEVCGIDGALEMAD